MSFKTWQKYDFFPLCKSFFLKQKSFNLGIDVDSDDEIDFMTQASSSPIRKVNKLEQIDVPPIPNVWCVYNSTQILH